ncbi:hypothetical protein H4R26_002799 [Coemansia thaxteri]|uniref:Uncharacterized protein n=1 Tax=Coemansia thaxteri TaxID=2663907 RepID=A0A9W8BJ61_9FUNG|nr:hypothetical protein H4R26_002799 [Coemansia thaxteri]
MTQRRPGEPDDLPIIGSDGPSPSKKENKAVKPKKADAPVVPPPKQQPSVPQDLGWERRNNGVVVGSSGGGGSMVRNLDVEGSAARTAASAGAVAASIVAVVLNFY